MGGTEMSKDEAEFDEDQYEPETEGRYGDVTNGINREIVIGAVGAGLAFFAFIVLYAFYKMPELFG